MATIHGSTGPDVLESESFTIFGDELRGYEGDDVLVFSYTSSARFDSADGGAGRDRIVVSGDFQDFDVNFSNEGSDLVGLVKGDYWLFIENSEIIEFTFGDTRLEKIDINEHENSDNIYRLYKAAFNRIPDKDGFLGWNDSFTDPRSINEVASAFIASPEFKIKYGENLPDESFIQTLYQNVLGREPDSAGFDHWMSQIDAGMQRADLLLNFSDSPENVQATASMIDHGYWMVL